MKQKLIPETSFCGCCRKELPLEAFYIEKNTQRPDRYCKECRRAASNVRYYHVQAAEHTHRNRRPRPAYGAHNACLAGGERKCGPQEKTFA